MLQRLSSGSLALTLLLCPFTGVCLQTLAQGRPAAVGIQPAHITGLVLVLALLAAGRWRLQSRWGWAVAAAVVWTAASTTALWRLDDVGLAGEAPWSKGLKQLVLLGVGLALACAPPLVLHGARDPQRELRRWERAATAGLTLVAAYGLYQAAAFTLDLPGELLLARWVTSNPSVASGSGELYLGHRFVGVPRVFAASCEPLYLAAYLLMAVPIAVAGAIGARGVGRIWRLVVVAAGTACFVLTFARGAWFGAGVLVLLVAWGMRRGMVPRPAGARWVWGAVGAVVLMAALVGVFAGRAPWEVPVLLFRRVAQTLAAHDMSNLTRVYAWRVASALALQHPAVGAGWGGFGFWYFPLAPAGYAAAHFGWPTPNSLPLQLLAETGFVGLLLWGSALRPALRGLGTASGRAGGGAPRGRFLMGAVLLAAWAQALTYFQIHLLYFYLLHGVAAAVLADRRPPAAGGGLV